MGDETDGNEDLNLNEDQMASIAKMVFDMQAKAATPTEPAKPTEPATPVTPTVAPAEGNTPFTLEQMTAAMTDVFKQNQELESGKVYESLWGEKLSGALAATPGLSEFLDGTDDYGEVRKDKLTNIKDYDKRIASLNTLTNSFREASAGTPGRKPTVSPKAQAKAKESQDKYDDIQQKLRTGEFKSAADFAQAWMGTMTEEMTGLSS